jgi:CBS domain-containing protein
MNHGSQFMSDALFELDSERARLLEHELRVVCTAIGDATNMSGLQRAASDIRSLVHRMIEMAPTEVITRLISTLNDALTRGVIELAKGAAPESAACWCWIALGSEGRQEQTLSSDQDNGIIFADGGKGDDGDALRALLLPPALGINQALDACGFVLCPGQIMASNPKWCLSLHEWKERFAVWIIEGDPQALLNASIFFDLRPLYGAYDLAKSLAEWLAMNAPDNPRFLFQMAENALRRAPPLGLLHDFVAEKEGEFAGSIDLKHNAATLFIDAARIYGLACGARTANTAERLRLAAVAGRLPADEVEAWIHAFHFIQLLRLKNQHRSYVDGAAMHNHVDPNLLRAADRHRLLDALRQARSLQKRLAMDYLHRV